MKMKTHRGMIVVGAMLVMALAFAGDTFAQGWLDQYQFSPGVSGSTFQGNVYGQEVVPSGSTISAVSLGLFVFSPGQDTVTVEILNGACDASGSVVASVSQLVAPPELFFGGPPTRIDFASPVPVTPGATYTLRVTAANPGIVGIWFSSPDPYPAGRLCLNGVAGGDSDIQFGTFVGTANLPANCTPEPLSGCAASAKGTIKVLDNAVDAKDSLQWQYGAPLVAIGPDDFGAPTARASAGVQICIYDETGSTPAPVFGAYLEAETCRPKPCWKSNKTGTTYSFKSKTGSTAGVVSAQLKSGLAGKGKIMLKAKGTAIPLPAPVSGTEFFDQDPRLTVQLRPLGSHACFESVFDTTTTKTNAVDQFKAVLK